MLFYPALLYNIISIDTKNGYIMIYIYSKEITPQILDMYWNAHFQHNELWGGVISHISKSLALNRSPAFPYYQFIGMIS